MSFLTKGLLTAVVLAFGLMIGPRVFSGAGVKAQYANHNRAVLRSPERFAVKKGVDSPPYPLVETFDSPADFIQTSDHVFIADGRVHWDVKGDGPQFVYRSIPPFSGDFRLTVRGTIEGGEYNCGVGAGVGDALDHGVGVGFELTGGGCDIHGPLIAAYGVDLHHRYLGCQPQGTFLWVQSGKAYTATLTFTHPEGTLAVDGVGEQTATPQYEGVIDTLMVGREGNPGMLRCVGSVDTIIIEPLNALIAPTNLTATASYPTQIELTWRENATGEDEIRVERWDAEVGWQTMVALPADAAAWHDSAVMCDSHYRYRVAAYKADGTFSGYSPVAEVTTAPCIDVLREDWESGIDVKVWRAYGFPRPELRAGEGISHSVALDPNGDGIFASGVITQKRFDTTSGIEAQAWIRSRSPVGQIYSGLEFALSTCRAWDRYEECGPYTNVAHVISYPEENRVAYQVLLHKAFNEVFAPMNDAWQHYRIRIRPDGRVAFYRNDILTFVDPDPIDLSAYPALTIDVRGRSINSEHYIDNIQVKTPAKPAWYVHVVDKDGFPVSGAVVYANGEPLGKTNQAGMVNVAFLEEGTLLTALKLVKEGSTYRGEHDGWAYRTYLTSLDWRQGEALPYRVQGAGEQRLVLHTHHPLTLFNLVVSVEWDADAAYLQTLARALGHASDYLLDVTDGQMALGYVRIYENAEHWSDADIQIFTRNIVRPHAYIGGLTDADTSHTIRLGRAWNGSSGAQGAWDAPDGYRTIIHEFGHYALYLWDEYIGIQRNQANEIIGEIPTTCTGPENREAATEDINASVMDWQYTSTELSCRGIEGLWSGDCEETLQFSMTGQSAWETVAEQYRDTQSPPRWQLETPLGRHAIWSGPHHLPPSLPTWPQVSVIADATHTQPRQLVVLGPDDAPYPFAIVALYKLDGRVIGQGLTDNTGQIQIFGAEQGDLVRASSIDGGLAGKVKVETPELPLTLHLAPPGMRWAQVHSSPFIQIIPRSGPDPDHIDLFVLLHHFDADITPIVAMTLPGERTEYTPVLHYTPATGIFEGHIAMSAERLGTGHIRVVGVADDVLVRQQTTFRLQSSQNNRYQEIFSDDGNLELFLDEGSLPGNRTYLVVSTMGTLQGPPPAGYSVVGDIYNLTASGAASVLEKPGLIRLRYDNAMLPSALSPRHLKIFHWNPVSRAWEPLTVSVTLDESRKMITAPVSVLGTYALMRPSRFQVYLPAMTN